MKTSLLAMSVLTFTLLSAAAYAADTYPLTTCVVSGEKLGEMGAPVVTNYKGTEVRFCCSGCVKKFNADPDKYLAKLDKKDSSH
jgi:YHS domain-containing protein